jgi:hypothetical protein
MKGIYTVLILLLVITGCSKKEGIQFCEGVDNNGKGVSCGKKFTTGDVTAVMERGDETDAAALTVKVIDTTAPDGTVANTLKIETEGEKPYISFNLPLYSEGNFRIEAYSVDEKKAEGTIEIVDTY